MAAGIVGQDGVVDAMAAQFKGGQRGALVAGTGLIDPDMEGNAGVMRQIDRRQGGAVIHRRQPAGIAMGEDVELLPGFFGGDALDDFQAMFADGFAHGHVFIGDGGGLGPSQRGALVAGTVQKRVPHAAQGPAQINGGGAGLRQHVMHPRKIFIGGIAAHFQRQAVGRHGADQRGAAGLHAGDGVGGVRRRVQCQGDKFMRQFRLVDDAESIFADGPDRTVMFAANLHFR